MENTQKDNFLNAPKSLQLSDDLTIIETEIKSYQNIAGQSIFEIGRRLKHVKENDLVHGEFGKWLKTINMSNQQAHRFMKVSEEFTNLTTSLNLGLNALEMIATLPVEKLGCLDFWIT